MKYTWYLLLLLLLASCDETIHEYPKPTKSLVILEVNVDRSPMKMYRQVTYSDGWERSICEFPRDSMAPCYHANEGLHMRIIVEVLRGRMPQSVSQVKSSDIVARREIFVDKDAGAPQDTLHFHLDQGEYYVLAWADYADKATCPGSAFYKTDSLTAVTTSFENYPVTSLDRACATGQQQFLVDFHLSAEGYPSLKEDAKTPLLSRVIPVELKRPVGLFKVYATDYRQFVNQKMYLDDIIVQCRYKMFVGAGHNVFTDEPNKFISTYTFLTKPMSEDTREGDEVFIFGDYLFTGAAKESNIVADFTFLDKHTGEKVGEIENVNFPVMRSQQTDIRGSFLTGGNAKGQGGLNIDENFAGEYTIHL